MLICKDVGHDIGSATDPRNTDPFPFQIFGAVDGALRSDTDRPTQWTVDVCANQLVYRCLALGLGLSEVCNEALRQAYCDINAVILKGCHKGSSPCRKWQDVGVKVEILSGKV